MTQEKTNYIKNKLHLWVMAFGCITLSIPLIGYLLIGLNMRYSGDDYCYGAVLSRLGFWKALWNSYFYPQAYNGNRYALTLFSELGGLVGPFMNGILPGFAIIIWFLGTGFALRSFASFVSFPARLIEIFFLAELQIFFTLYQAPNLLQSLFWRSGMLPYLMPLIMNIFLFGIILRLIKKREIRLGGLAIIAFLAIIAGGFSETATSFQIGYLFLLLLSALYAHHIKKEWASRAILLVGIAFIASLFALFLLAVSPSNTERLLKSARPDVITSIWISINSTVEFVIGSFKSQPVPILILFFTSIAVSWSILQSYGWDKRYSKNQYLVSFIVILTATIILVFCCMLPSAFVQAASPELRALLIPRFILVLSTIISGILIGLLTRQLVILSQHCTNYALYLPIILLGILCFYPLYSTRNLFGEINKYQRWSTFWDKRNQDILFAKQNNMLDVEVIKIDHIIPGVGDLSEDPGYWYNVCAAEYYSIRSITANKPGWDFQEP